MALRLAPSAQQANIQRRKQQKKQMLARLVERVTMHQPIERHALQYRMLMFSSLNRLL